MKKPLEYQNPKTIALGGVKLDQSNSSESAI
jgi:hypothetical protein